MAMRRGKDMQPIELRLDTLCSFQLAIFALDLLRHWARVLVVSPDRGLVPIVVPIVVPL